MIVTCEACFTTFKLNDELIKPSGTKVRCSKCQKVFKVFPFDPEEISPPLPAGLFDTPPEFSLSPPLVEIPALDNPVARQMAAPDHSPEPPDLPEDFKDISELDFSELDKFLQEDVKDKSESAFSNLQENRASEIFALSGEPSDQLSDSADETPEQALSEISLDGSVDGSDNQPAGMDLKTETELDFSESKHLDLSLDDFEKSLEMDFSDISLVSADESETATEQNKEVAATEIKSGQTPEEAPIPSDKPLETLEMDDQYLTFDELQLDLDDSKSAPPAAPSLRPEPVSPEAESGMVEKDISADVVIDEDMEETGPAPKKGISPAILIALILTVIAAVGYGGYMLLKSNGISIPFINQSAPKVSDPGNISIKILDINSKFVDNDKIGKLFVITGKVKNEYPMTRAFIRINGKIYTKDKAMAKTETVFCGNIISDMDLAHADSATLQKRLQNRAGDNNSNQKVLSGATIPFMIVFSNLPTNLDEFSTEIVSSVAL